MFGGTRTYHRLACAIEDAGFEIRDCLSWMYGSGFPKSHDISKAIDKAAGAEDAKRWQGRGTSLKPAWEPIILARKPFKGTVAANCLEYGTGALNIDGCRIGTSGGTQKANVQRGVPNGDRSGKVLGENISFKCDVAQLDAGRWPANVLLDEEAGAMLDEQSGYSKSPSGLITQGGDHFSVGSIKKTRGTKFQGHGDSGGASRFFYCAKASKKDRGEGNNHPTVKPVSLMRWLVRLASGPNPAEDLIFDPFAGSGTTGVACNLEGVPYLLIEKDPEYAEIARSRTTLQATGT